MKGDRIIIRVLRFGSFSGVSVHYETCMGMSFSSYAKRNREPWIFECRWLVIDINCYFWWLNGKMWINTLEVRNGRDSYRPTLILRSREWLTLGLVALLQVSHLLQGKERKGESGGRSMECLPLRIGSEWRIKRVLSTQDHVPWQWQSLPEKELSWSFFSVTAFVFFAHQTVLWLLASAANQIKSSSSSPILLLLSFLNDFISFAYLELRSLKCQSLQGISLFLLSLP